MSRIIFVPQYPTRMRYQEWWFTEFPNQFREAGFEVVTLGEAYYKMTKRIPKEDEVFSAEEFSPIKSAIGFETAQINQYMNIDLKKDDILFLADLSFPGIFSNVLFHKRPERMFAFCHATSINKLDYFEKDMMVKFPIERAHSRLFDAVFVGSNYHEDRLKFDNTLVTRLPYPTMKYRFNGHKKYDIVSVSRPTPQKVDAGIESLVEGEFNTRVIRRKFNIWFDYYSFLSQSKVLLITAKEETFGYQVIDAVLSGCIPIAPNKFSYVELLPRNYLYDNREELLETLEAVFDRNIDVPAILCTQEIENFYDNIIQIMKG